MDGVEGLNNVTIVAATNRPDMIDKVWVVIYVLVLILQKSGAHFIYISLPIHKVTGDSSYLL